MSTIKSNMKTGEDIVKALAETSQKDNEVYYVDHGNGLIEVGTDEEARKFGIPKSEWEDLQKYDLDRDPQFIEKLNRDSEEFYTTVLSETPEEKEERKEKIKTGEFWRINSLTQKKPKKKFDEIGYKIEERIIVKK
mgnify:CR=1 FL=1